MVTETKQKVTYTDLLGKIQKAWRYGKRRVWLEGGTYSSKTWSVMQFLKMIAENYPDPLHITVISETMPHLKQGAMLDFKHVMGDDFRENWWNKTDFIYKWPTGSWMQFLSADAPSKAAGPRRDILFANELNHIHKDTFRQADMRTHLFTIADWNPESEFWFHEDNVVKDTNGNLLRDEKGDYVLLNPKKESSFHCIYLDALEVMPPGKREEIEELEHKDPNAWRIYGLGLLGKITGLVYPNFEQVDELPEGSRFYGLDFGFSSDPTVLTAHVLVGDKLYSQEMFYDYSGLTNPQISMKMELAKVSHSSPIYPDPNEPKSATELRELGWTIGDTVKGKGSVKFGRKAVNNYYQHWTKDSLNCIKEQRNFRFIADKNGILTDETTHRWSHGMDSTRYACASHKGGIRTYRTTIPDRRLVSTRIPRRTLVRR